MCMSGKGMVYLVGAGPGDPGLITVKGLDCVRKADVLVYDRLAGQGILSCARPKAELIYVGKSPERHTMRQEEINRLLVEKALAGKTVTRLKGGDPFVFGRGGEEAEALYEAGIPFEVVPGITSAVAVPAYAGIPVTHRGLASTFAVITGNEDPDKEETDINWEKIATGAGTLVFLMGMGNLAAIADRLIRHGRPAGTPAAVIRWGTTASQKTLTGTLGDIAEKAAQKGFANPSVIVVGEVVGLREKLNWYEKKPLFGTRVLVTRSREQAGVLSRAIEELGGQAVEFPAISIADPCDFGPLDRALARVSDYRWIIFTSANGVNYFFDRLIKAGGDIRDLKGVNICAIGPKTRDCLAAYGLRVEYVPGEYRAEEIAAGLRGRISPGDPVLLPRADIARKALAELLEREGARVDEVVAYRTVAGDGRREEVRRMVRNGEIDIITFTSSSTVKNFLSLAGEDLLPLPEGVRVACIGPVTAGTARSMGLPVHIEAEEYTIEGLVKAIVKELGIGDWGLGRNLELRPTCR
ncbi:MAG: uroporphyrinogen-III C-methyltransferase [Peptococcaceae bacterium]|nr:uroporphyrinogen-III C-methyltransferase [Peptococcaceae bacterium]